MNSPLVASAKRLESQLFAELIFEGGAIEGNGEGTVLTTEKLSAQSNRNQGLGRKQMEQVLSDWLQAANIVWLPGSWNHRR